MRALNPTTKAAQCDVVMIEDEAWASEADVTYLWPMDADGAWSEMQVEEVEWDTT
jgi:hypothetical protein